MARILYVFPHPDDESFGPVPVLNAQRRQGHEVFLLTLTRGEATKQRANYGYTKEEMGAVRTREMEAVAGVLELADLTVLDFPDGGLDELDPLVLEEAVARHVEQVRPHVVVTYAIHGISGHPDHLVAHQLVKRVYCALRAEGASYLKRLAFFTLPDSRKAHLPPHLHTTPDEEIDCVVPFDEDDRRRGEEALACYETYQEVIAQHRPLDNVGTSVAFVLFQESPRPKLRDLFEGLG